MPQMLWRKPTPAVSRVQKGSPCALGLKREPPDLPDGDIPTTEYPSIRSLEGDNCVFSLLTGTNEQEGGVDVFFASGLPEIPELVSRNSHRIKEWSRRPQEFKPGRSLLQANRGSPLWGTCGLP